MASLLMLGGTKMKTFGLFLLSLHVSIFCSGCLLAEDNISPRKYSVKNGQEFISIRGEVTFDKFGKAIIQECSSGKIIEIGVMASGSYFDFSQKHAELTKEGKVIVILTGKLNEQKEFILKDPIVKDMLSDSCDVLNNEQLEHPVPRNNRKSQPIADNELGE